MHHALEIEEILANIFYHCSPPILSFDDFAKPGSVLATLARTCRAFKEPALDALWMSLPNIAPLAQCLPDASYRVSHRYIEYSFSRPLSNSEWDILRGYARRIRCIRYIRDELDEGALEFLSNHSIAESLFPSLRYLRCVFTQATMFLLRFPLSSLISLSIHFEDSTSSQHFFNSFAVSTPNIRRLSIVISCVYHDDTITEPGCLCRWQDLCSVEVCGIPLDRDSIEHLSRMPALTVLSIKLSVTPPASVLSFPDLKSLSLHSTHLHSVTRFFSHTHLPAITDLDITIDECPAIQELPSFWDSLLGSNAGRTIENLTLDHSYNDTSTERAGHLGLEDLRSCVEFKHLHRFILNLECNICLSDSDLLTLAFAWPELEHIEVNRHHAWNSEYGITPGGLVRLLEACPSLRSVSLRLDTRGYIEVPPGEFPAILRLTLPSKFFIDVLDSTIEEESVPAVTAFFSGLATGCSSALRLYYWDFMDYSAPSGQRRRWDNVRGRMTHR